MTEIQADPEVTMVFEYRKAASDCCGAGLALHEGHLGRYRCVTCGQPCERVLGAPTEVTARG